MSEGIPHFEHRDKPGHKGEEDLEKFFQAYEKLGAVVKINEEDYGKELDLKVDGYCRACEETDTVEGIDFFYYRAHDKSWHKWDITSEKDHIKRAEKEAKNSALGIKTPFLPLYILREAAESVATVIKEDLNRSQQKVWKELARVTAPQEMERTPA
ncbi:hypothetical protein ACFLZK_01470 [Patescibacteria group bacterium]